MPIADILRHRELSLSYDATGYERKVQKHYDHEVGVGIGLFDRAEINLGHDFLGGESAQLILLLTEGSWGALSVGADSEATQFVAGRIDLAWCRLHCCGLWAGREKFVGVGADFDLGQYGSAGADYLGGPNGVASVAWGMDIAEGLSLTISASRPNRGSNGWSHGAGLSYGMRF